MPTTIETCAPRYATARSPERKTLARAAVRLARAMGVELMPWQRQVLEVALEVDEHGRLIFRDVVLGTPRQSGKTLLELLVMLVRAMLQPRQNITYSAQSALEARKKLVDDWLPMIEASPLGSQISSYLAPGRESLRFANGSQVQIVASTAKAGHGLVVDLGIIDEAFSYRDARLEQSLRPAMMTRPSPQLWCVSTAGTPDASPYLLERVESGRQAVEAGITTGLAYFEWSAEDDADPADPETWRSCMPALNHTVTEDVVRAAQLSMPRSEFARAYLNRWVASMGDPVIDIDLWESLAAPDAPRPESLILGVDVSPRSKFAAIAAAGVHDGSLHVSVLESGPGTEWVAGRLEELQEELGAEAVVDPKAVASIMPEIDHLNIAEVDGNEMAAACAFLVDLVGRGRLHHRGERELQIALDGAVMRPLGDQWAWSRKNSGTDITPLVAATLACWGFRWDDWGAEP